MKFQYLYNFIFSYYSLCNKNVIFFLFFSAIIERDKTIVVIEKIKIFQILEDKMLSYNFNMLDNYIKSNLIINLKTEKDYDNNILIVSEKEQKAYLPFFYSEVRDIYLNSDNTYSTLQDVVNDLYVVPLSRFRNSAFARFRESFRLIRDKNKGSITKALDLGIELMFKYELNPIVIAACRNLDELDIYLDCLEENELYDFTCFKIKFEVMPQLVKKRKEKKYTFQH